MTLVRSCWKTLVSCVVVVAALFGGAGSALLGICGPFTDVSDAAFCPFVLEIFILGITTGTTPTTYDPAGTVNRLQMAAFLSRSVDGVLKRGGRRAALNRFWTTEANASLALTTVGSLPELLVSDGEDIWVSNSGTISRVHGSDGKLLQTWTGAAEAIGMLSAMGKVFATGNTNPGALYRIDPSQPAGGVTTVASDLGIGPFGMTYDGSRIWTTGNGSLSIVTPGAAIPWTTTTVTTGFDRLNGMLYDGANVWATNGNPPALLKLDSAGAILQTVTLGGSVQLPIFDGSNIWVPNFNISTVSVVRASNGVVLATLTGNGLNQPYAAAFDGQRILITNDAGHSVSLWKAADLTPLGSFGTGAGNPLGACSDGINFWIVLSSTGQLARF